MSKKQTEPKKPERAEFYGWAKFVAYCEANGILLEHREDWEAWWDCWKNGFIAAMNS